MTCPIPAPVLPAIHNIVFATDFSESSLAALPYIHRLTSWYGAAVHVVHVVRPEPSIELPLDFPVELDGDRNAALSEIKNMLGANPFGNVTTTSTVERGDLWGVMNGVIQERGADLIVVGTRGRGGLGKIVMGSFAEQIYRQSRLPVLTVGPHCNENLPLRGSLRTVLFATDFSLATERALAWAASLCRFGAARLTLLHVIVPGPAAVPSSNVIDVLSDVGDELIAQGQEEARGKLSALLADPMLQGIDAGSRIEVGAPVDTILEVAADVRADVIVMGARHSDDARLASHIPWSTASGVVRSAACPVLTVRS
ncbi:MAG: universal stress protein [Acidobacteriota bacterium]|nr:universal stress protein [Acidobacteriota bacterium]